MRFTRDRVLSAKSAREIVMREYSAPEVHRFPYVPGVEVVGVIEESGAAVHEVCAGDRVITMMQGMGGVIDHPRADASAFFSAS